MKKRIIVFFLYLLLITSTNYIWSQPNPGDSQLGAASGQTVGHVPGGGADLEGGLFMLLVPALLYFAVKFKWNFSGFYHKARSRFCRIKFSFIYSIWALKS